MASPRSELLEPIDIAVAKWSKIVVPIFVESPKSAHAVLGIGSAFLLKTDINHLLVTALHVVNEANKFGLQVANICGTGVDMRGFELKGFPEIDVAVAEVGNAWLKERGVLTVSAAPLIPRHADYERTGIHVLIGYPGTRNELDARYGRTKRHCYSFTAERVGVQSITTPVQAPLILGYQRKSLIAASGVKLGPQPDLHGMSGGPCLELIRSKHDEASFDFDVVGVISEWHQKEKAIVVSPLPWSLPAARADA